MRPCSLADQGTSEEAADLDNRKGRERKLSAKALRQKPSPWRSAVAEQKAWNGNGELPHPLSGLPLLCAYTTLLGLALAAVPGNEAIFSYNLPLLWD